MSRILNTRQILVETVTVTTAGTAVSPTAANIPDGVEIVFRAHPSNTGTIKISDTAAKAQQASGVGNVPLAAEQSISFQLADPSLVFVDATVSGERVIVSAEF